MEAGLIQKDNIKMLTKEHLFLIHDPKAANTKSKALIKSLSEIYTGTEQQHKLGNDDLFKCIRMLLCFGRIIGIVPLSGLFKPSIGSVHFSFRSVGSIISLTLVLGMAINEVVAIFAFFRAPARDATEMAKNSAGLVCYGIGIFVYVYMYRNSDKLIECLHKWRDLRTSFYKEDTHLFRNILLLSGTIYTSAILENTVSHWQYFKAAFLTRSQKDGVGVQLSLWENYFLEAHPQYAKIIPYNIVSAIGIFICNKLAVYAWNFGDILIAVLSRGIYKRFENHLRVFKERVDANEQDQIMWIQAVKEHENLVDIMKEFKHLLSPLIFACTATNIYFICLTLNSFLVPSNEDAVNSIYEAWAFIHLIARTFTAILLCARVNTHVHKIEHVLIKCPVSVLTKEVERAELRLRTSCLGFDGLACYVITNGFALSVFSVIFTFEIVLLQSTAPPSASTSSPAILKP